MSVYGTNKDPLGGRDRLGTDGMKGGFPSDNENVNESDNFTAKKVYHQIKDSIDTNKKLIFEKKQEDNTKLLDENQLKDLDN